MVPAHDTRLYRYLSGLDRLQKIRQGLVVALTKCPAKIAEPQPGKMLVKSNSGAAPLEHRTTAFYTWKSEPWDIENTVFYRNSLVFCQTIRFFLTEKSMYSVFQLKHPHWMTSIALSSKTGRDFRWTFCQCHDQTLSDLL